MLPEPDFPAVRGIYFLFADLATTLGLLPLSAMSLVPAVVIRFFFTVLARLWNFDCAQDFTHGQLLHDVESATSSLEVNFQR